MRAAGRPFASTVASVIAVELRMIFAASASHAASSGIGSAGSVSGSGGIGCAMLAGHRIMTHALQDLHAARAARSRGRLRAALRRVVATLSASERRPRLWAVLAATLHDL